MILTAHEYGALPEDNRMEFVDGIIRMGPTPTRRHQIVADNLRVALKAVCPDDLRIVGVQEVRIGELHRRNPDLMAIQAVADDLDAASFAPAAVAMAIEVVGPGTETTDRLHKPAEYASAGIEHYWRIEIQPAVEVHTYRLGESGRYLESGLFTPGDTITAPGLPWAKIEVSDLEP